MTWPGRELVFALLSCTALLLGSPDLAAQEAATPASLRWAGAPPLLPPGAMIAVVSGDPAGPGQSTIQLSMPDGYRMPPHFHPTDERVEVRQGTLLVGMGDRFDAGKTMAGFHHYSIARGTTVVSVRFTGPYTITSIWLLAGKHLDRQRIFRRLGSAPSVASGGMDGQTSHLPRLLGKAGEAGAGAVARSPGRRAR